MRLWLPNTVNYAAYKVDRAVNEYDERLMFARNEDTGDWCVFIRMPRPRDPFPVMGFGEYIPDVSVVMDRIREADTLRTGNEIYNEVVRSQEEYKNSLNYEANQAAEESAEVIEHFLRKHGKSPVVKEFITSNVPKGGE